MKVLWATDGSENSRCAAVLLSHFLRDRAATIYVMTVAPGGMVPYADPTWFAISGAAASYDVTDGLQAAHAIAQDSGSALTLPDATIEIVERAGKPVSEIVESAKDLEVDLVVVGAKGHGGVEGFLLGSVASGVVKRCHASVLVARDIIGEMDQVLLPTDGSDYAAQSEHVLDDLNLTTTTVTVMSCVPSFVLPYTGMAVGGSVYAGDVVQDIENAEAAETQRVVHEVAERLRARGMTVAELVRPGRPADEISLVAEELKSDLIVIGSRGRRGLKRLVMGSVAGEVADEAKCSVLIVRPPADGSWADND
jgi:nucleotide-binding universal stress UspA family protein